MLMKSNLNGDSDQIKQFLNTIFKHCNLNEGFISLRAFAHEGNVSTHSEWRKFDTSLPQRVAEVATIVAHFLQSEKSSVFCPPVCLFKVPTKAIEDNVLCAPAVTVELDSNPTEALDTLRAILGEPTCIVASGGTWEDASGAKQDKLHLHWRLERPATGPDLPMLKLVRRYAAAIVKADMTAVPVVHPLRWPGSWHTKGEPRLCRIVGGDEHHDINLYDAYAQLSEIAAAMKIEGLSEEINTEGFKTDDPWTADALNAAADLIENDADWNAWNRLGMATFDASHGSEDGRAAFHTISAKNDKYDPGTTDARWDHYHRSPPTRTSAGTLIYEARKVDPDFHKRVGDPSIYFETSPPSSENLSKSLSNKDATPKKKEFKFVDFDDAASRAISAQGKPLIKGLLDQGAMTILYGPSNVGKTFVTMDLAYHVAANLPYGGMRTTGGAVVYVAAEGGRGVYQRVAALKAKYKTGSVPFHILPASVDLRRKDADLAPLVEAVKGLGVPVALIVVDTLSRAMAGGDENSSVDMGNIVTHFDALREQTSAHLLVVHHTGKNIAQGARGHSLLRAATDTEIEISEGVFEVTKQRDLPKSWSSAFGLDVVTLGRDADGDPITSCTVKLVSKAEGFEGDLNVKEAAVYRAVSELDAFADGANEGATLADVEDFLARSDDKLSRDVIRHSLRTLAAKRAIKKVARGKWAANRQNVFGETSPSQFVETFCSGEISPNSSPNSFE